MIDVLFMDACIIIGIIVGALLPSNRHGPPRLVAMGLGAVCMYLALVYPFYRGLRRYPMLLFVGARVAGDVIRRDFTSAATGLVSAEGDMVDGDRSMDRLGNRSPLILPIQWLQSTMSPSTPWESRVATTLVTAAIPRACPPGAWI
jgi:hypothetical protein